MARRKFDIVVFGATSFVGQILTSYLFNSASAGERFRWAIAGRNEDKLKELRASLGEGAKRLPIIVADAGDSSALLTLCDQTRVVVSTVGPYALYGEPLIRACVSSGTDYCDLTGEVQWIKQMIHRYEREAKRSGSRIVHCCGFDSIPSDMGVWFLQQAAQERFGEACTQVKMRVKRIKGQASGGTVASMINVTKEAVAKPELRKELANPFSICGALNENKARQVNVNAATYDKDFSSWSAPFVMAAVNTRVVHRSNFLAQYAYGKAFQYDEALLSGEGAKGWMRAQSITAGLGAFLAASAVKPSRWLLERFVVPAPGEGPSPEAQAAGFYDLRFIGKTESGDALQVQVRGDADPGYGSTAKMLGQAALCLAKDIKKEPGGFWTPATLFGAKLQKRLEASSGVSFEVKD